MNKKIIDIDVEFLDLEDNFFNEASIKRRTANILHKKGKKDTEETRLKKSIAHTGIKKPYHSQKLLGRKRPKFAKKMKGKQIGEKNGNSKIYIITEPNGKTYEIKSLRLFAKLLGKPLVTAREMAKGLYPNNIAKKGLWSGWKIVPK